MYNMDIMRHSACLVVNQITVYSYDFPFECTTGGGGGGGPGLRLNDDPDVKL